ncbi:MAG: hypothetical protein Q4A67_07360, partial [Aerococcus sp.]|nr:hypothetical protein [Aerococcus sp.]
MFIVSFFLFIFFSTPSFAETSSTEKPDSSELAYCGYGGSCRTAYSSPVIETRLARYDPDMFCSGYHACSGLNHYCGSSPAIQTSQAPSTVGQFVMTRWSSYRVWDTKKEKWLSCGLQFEGGEGDLTVDYNKTPTKEDCLARPVI